MGVAMNDVLFVLSVLILLGLGAVVVGLVLRVTQVTGDAFIRGVASIGCGVASKLKACKEGRDRVRAENDQRRRAVTRSVAEAFFQLHKHDLAPRFDKAAFDEWAGKYMHDGCSPEFVEERGRQLIALMDAIRNTLPDTTTPSAEVKAARDDVEAFYQERPEIHTVCPPRRFLAEMRVRIPDDASAETARKEARDMMKELLDISALEEENRKAQPGVPHNPPLSNV